MFCFFFFKQKTAYEMLRSLVGSEMCIRDSYYIKQYEQETNYVANVLLDGSESMKYGSGKLTKLQYGKVVAACLAYLILHQRDAAALALFDTTVRDYSPRSDNLASIHHLMAKLAAFEPREQTQIGTVPV